MRNFFTILSMLVTLSVTAQQINPQTASICSGNSQVYVGQVPNYNTDTLNFNWFINGLPFGGNNDTVNTGVLTTGNYSIMLQVTDSVGNTTQQIGNFTFATLTVNALPTVTLASYGPVCVNSGNFNLANTLTESPTGGTFKVDNVVASNFNPNVLGVGAHQVRYIYTNGSGCTDSTNINIVVNPVPTINNIASSPVLCFGGSSGSATVNASGNGLTYAWSTNPTQTAVTATGLMAGTYAVTVMNNNGCTATLSTFIGQPSNAVSANTFVISNVSCFGGSTGAARVVATGGTGNYSFNWLPGGIQNDTATNLTAGIYTAFVTDANGCPASAPVTINQPTSAVTVTVDSVKSVSCFGGTNGKVYVTPSGGTIPYSYGWTGGSTNQDLLNVGAGTYTITVTDANGCTATNNAGVTQPSTAVGVNAFGTNVNCFGGTTTINAGAYNGTPSYTYLWNGSLNGPTQTVGIGTYIVVATDANGCNASDTVSITEPTQVGFTTTQVNVLCNGSNTGSISATATGGVGSYQYRLNNGNWGTSNTFSGLAAGTYTVSVKDANGCIAGPTTIVLTQSNALQANANNTPQGCTYLGKAWASPSGGLGPYTFQWSNSLGTNDSIQAVAGTYTVTVTDANGCQSVDIAVIATPTPVNITGITTNPTCFGNNNGSMNITVTGNAPFTYQWSNGATTQDITSLGSSNPYTVIATASNGCQGVWTDTLVLPTPLNISVNNDTTLCFGTNSGSLTSLATGGTGNYSFAWSPSGGNAGIANGLNAGVYTVVVTDANGCTATNQGQVFNAPALQINAVATPVQCAGNSNGEIDLTVTGGTPIYQYSWTGPSGFAQISGDITGLAAGNYNVTATDANGCTATYATTVLGSNNPIVVQWYTVQNPCQGTNNGGITVNASGGVSPYTFTWGDGFIGPIRTGLLAGTYTVMITDATGCQVGPFGQTLTANAGISITTPSVVDYCVGSGNLIPLTVTGGTQPYGYQWTDPNGTFFGTSQAIEPMVNGQYLGGIWTGIVTDGLGCSQTIYITVNITTCPTAIAEQSDDGFHVSVFPNPISSNGIVTIQWPSNIHEVITIDVKNITGQSVFHAKTNDAQYTINTSGLSSGTYMVQIASRDQLITKKLVVQ